MIHYLLQTIAFQLFFLMVYDLFLKKETFFNWNRLYLWTTPVLSCIIPLIKIEKLGKAVPQEYIIALPEILVGPASEESVRNATVVTSLPAWQWVLIIGSALSLVLFLVKIGRVFRLRYKGRIIKQKAYEEVVLPDSNTAFSFFNSIYLGEAVYKKDHRHIIAHELVHIREKHSIDLLFFELLRIVFWFNPLVYMYQNRMAELHEFIADAGTAGPDKRESYRLLLQEVFHTEKISFINPFFRSSLIKKRIVMLQKSKSKKIWQFKYLVLVPLVLGMLVYSSCEKDTETPEAVPEGVDSVYVPYAVVDEVPVFPGCENAENPRECFQESLLKHIRKNFRYPEKAQEQGIQGRVSVMFTINKEGDITDIKMRGPSPFLEEEARRIIKLLPHMTPGKQKGKPINVPFSVPITFKLLSDSGHEQHAPVKGGPDERRVEAYRDLSKNDGYVYGSVLNSSKGLPGANIKVKGTGRGTVTDFDGNFRIRASKGDVVAVDFIGLPDTEFTVNDKNRYKIVM
ncbi:M56 family metallopeptidase [Sinomicrobium weinanense]|uniref:TonB family protein n=1 Tax=Sinomicrobium weinanense TaxID=2842200 RepID=A0A926JVW4_9FLAO|nr:M56 family metallopeptidase [Sinomicrobium weinanense]MBC9798440.1 TonB family protein [Sinomicrobium weinanense]MBU3125200.1 TonB family protein [Sinomicrobium weinanense]